MAPPRPLLVAVLALALSGADGRAQTEARVSNAENFRREPNGEVLGEVEPGTLLTVLGRQDRWLEVALEGWVWTRSLQVAGRDGFDLVVSATEGENIRLRPSGVILGRLERGTLLEELERRPGWIHVRRQGWVWAPSVVELAPSVPATSVQPPPALELPPPAEEFAAAGPGGTPILTAPDGDTLALAVPRSEIEVVARQGSWARVRLEGWAWLPPADTAEAGGEGGMELTPDALRAAPAEYRGRVVSWVLQFISLERAERVRTDFFEGEPFLLTRFGGADGAFVYVAVPPDRTTEVEGLTPLERISVSGRVRTGASALTGTPIVDLITLVRAGRPR